MAILIDENSRVIVQGITGTAGAFHTGEMQSYGTNIVAGTSPGKGGTSVHNIPVYDTVAECVTHHHADTAVIFLPAAAVKDAVIEAAHAGIKTVVVVPEHIPIADMMQVRREAKKCGALILGGNTAGIISPGRANIGIIPPLAFKRGRVGTVSRSGSITYYLADTLSRTGYGETTCVGLGGDPVLGSTFNDVLELFEKDPETKAVVLAGEIGGVYEEIAASTISKMSKPVIAIIGGVYAPPGKRMGHAGAIVEGEMGTANSKIKALESGGAHIAKTFKDIPDILARLGV
ncbi:succinate--CoA ligase subunit alpha [candidate division KSB1 bacterium]|nr:MAG: succinate--CoA ligase subunit alpha [candidate division KSB1 bacterium]